jgi:hypothetical protein
VLSWLKTSLSMAALYARVDALGSGSKAKTRVGKCLTERQRAQAPSSGITSSIT